MKYNCANHTITFNNGEFAAKLSDKITAPEAYRIARTWPDRVVKTVKGGPLLATAANT